MRHCFVIPSNASSGKQHIAFWNENNKYIVICSSSMKHNIPKQNMQWEKDYIHMSQVQWATFRMAPLILTRASIRVMSRRTLLGLMVARKTILRTYGP
mmetsp:Transcript_32652/g.55586  ORF Transcript_32652/g.55586 Transcript_32652/m.55586 type:complete len:98 (-) Transcript_32652:126-419(-)